MQRSAWRWFGLAFLALAAVGCSDEGVGDPCIPETIQQRTVGGVVQYGFAPTESYIESSSVQCRSRLCIVHQLDNGTAGAIPADPRDEAVCENQARNGGAKPGCVPEASRALSVYCTCKCGGPKTAEQCECPDGFKCEKIDGLSLGPDGIRGSYCVRPRRAAATP